MQYGIIELAPNAYLRLKKGSNNIDLRAPATITSSYSVTFPAAPPGSTQAVTMDSSGNLAFTSLGGGGSVTSVGLSAPSIFNVSGSPVTLSGTLSLSLVSQSANTFFAAPNGSAGTPTFRGIAWADVSSLVGTTGSTFAVGNDARFHTQNTDTGTTQSSFQIDSGNSGPRIKNTSGVVELRNAADNAFASLRVNELFITGTATTIQSETVTINDNVIQLNSNVTSGTPTEDLGIQGLRGSSTSASLRWIESTGRWSAGLLGSELPLSRVFETTFTNASLTAGILTVTHNLGRRVVKVTVADSSFKEIIPDDITFTSTSALNIDFTSYGTLAGTLTVTCQG